MSLLSFAKKAKDVLPVHSLKYHLHQHLNGPEPARSLAVIHASDLTKPEGFCPRFAALHDAAGIKPKDGWLTASQELTYEIGRMVQDRVVHYFADMGKAVAHWRCLGCDHRHLFQKRPGKCVKCGCRAFKPEEVRFQSALNGASCGVDMLVGLGDKDLTPVEIKTMRPEEFKGLLAPLAEHKARSKLYLRLIDEDQGPYKGLVSTKMIKVLYVTKGGYGCADPNLKAWGLHEGFSPFKEFDLGREDALTDEYCKRAQVLTDFRKGKTGMPSGLCATALTARAMKCSVKGVCFSGDHPPVHHWQGGQE